MPAGMPRFTPNQTPPIQRTAPPLPTSGSWQPIRTRLPSGTPHPSGTSSADGFTAVCNGRSCLNEICLPAAIVQDRPTLSRPIARGLRQPRDNLNHLCNWHHRRCHVCRRRPARRLGRRRVAPLTALRMPFRPRVAAFRPSRSPARKAGIRTTADRRHRHIEPEPKATHPAAPNADSPQPQRATVDGFRLPQYGLKERELRATLGGGRMTGPPRRLDTDISRPR